MRDRSNEEDALGRARKFDEVLRVRNAFRLVIGTVTDLAAGIQRVECSPLMTIMLPLACARAEVELIERVFSNSSGNSRSGHENIGDRPVKSNAGLDNALFFRYVHHCFLSTHVPAQPVPIGSKQ